MSVFFRDALIRGHEDRQAETGEMMQRLVDADQRPEPGVLLSCVTPKVAAQKPLARSTVM